MTTWLAALRKKRCHPQLRVAIERSRPRAWLRPRATLGEVMRGSVIRGCARGSYRLQGVDRRRVALSRPAAKSLWITRTGLALLRESAGRANERRKPNRWWQNREIGGGFPPNRKDRENGPSWEHLSIGRRSGSGKSLALTRSGGSDPGSSRTSLGSPGDFGGRDRERQRSLASLVSRSTTPSLGGAT